MGKDFAGGFYLINFTDGSFQMMIMAPWRKSLVNLEGFDGTHDDLPGIFENVRLLALGEAAHGGSDFFRMKTELIKYLVLQRAFRVVIFEGAYGQRVDAYISGKRGDVREALKSLGSWFWHTREVEELVEWLKSYNESQPESERVRFYGCDMQHLRPIAEELRAYLHALGLATPDLITGLKWLQDLPLNNRYTQEEINRMESIRRALHTLKEEHRVAFHTDPFRAYHLRVFDQWYERQVLKQGDVNVREVFMAENCRFILNHHQKAIWWAHNVHIAKKKDDRQAMIPAGTDLTGWLGDGYYALGFGFNSGSITAHDGAAQGVVKLADAAETSSDWQFSRENYSRFLLDFRTLDEYYPLIHQPVSSRNTGARYYPDAGYRHHTLAESYDGLLFIRQIAATTLLSDGDER